MAGEKKSPEKPPGAGDDDSVEVEALFDDLFEDAPPTQPTVPVLQEDVTLEVPAAGTNPSPEVEVEAPAFFAPILPEMEAEIWQAGIQALVTVPERVDSPVTSYDDWHDHWLDEARLFQAESTSAETPVLAAGLLMAAARAAEIGGEAAEAASGYDEALARAPTAPDVLRARARLAESVGDFDEAHALWARLAMSAGMAEERAFYGALSAEWTLARRGALPAVALDAIPAGAARALAVVEEALRTGTPDAAAAAFAAAGRALGGRFGAAFLEQAARFSGMASDAASAATQRTAARKLDPDRNPTSAESLLGRLREAARSDRRGGTQIGTSGRAGADGTADLEQILAALPAGSALAQAVGRWAAARARRRGDPAGALALLTSLGPTTAAAARDRIDLEVLAAGALDDQSLARLRESATAPAAAANLLWIEAVDLVRRGEHETAAALLARGIEEHADAVPLALLAEEIAAATDDPVLEAATLDLWLRGDPARRAEAALALALTLEATGSGLNARAALQTAVESAPESASFWIAAASDARAGRRSDAAAALGFGAEVWEASSLVAGLRAAAAVKLAPSDPARALAGLGDAGNGSLSDAALALGPSAVARLAERAGDRAAFEAALEAAEAVTSDPAQAAWLALRRASSIASGENEADGQARVRSLERALEVVARHPMALGLYLAEPGIDAASAATVMARVGSSSPEISAFSRTMALTAASTLALSGDRQGALRCATETLAVAPTDPEALSAVARMAAALGGERGLRALAALPVRPAERDAARSLVVTEARIEIGALEAAGEALRILGDGRFGADARRAGARIDLPGVVPFPPGLFAGPLDRAAGESQAAVAAIVDAAAGARWDDLVAALSSAPPHEAVASAGTLALASLVAEGHGDDATAERLAEAAVRMDDATAPHPTLARVAGSAAETALRSRALTAVTARLGAAESDRRSAAAALAERARLEEAAGDPAAAAESWRAALAAEPTFLPAARALRIVGARTGDSAAASGASETEAACLLVPAHRVRALLLSAALALEANPPERERALGLLRAALAIDPAHDAAFERLRAVLTDQNDALALAAALAARIEVAVNPFEVTSLRLTRADILASTLGDWSAAREELEAVLLRQPEHARALERLSELLWSREAWGEAGEIYLRRAVVERDPGRLRGIFLRLGEVYSSRVPDPKRAAAAYERVLGVDADNLEALRALSDLTVAEGDLKRALPVTEKLVAHEPDQARRHRTRIRLGELLMQTGDLRRAAVELRRVVDESPRDLAAIGGLAQLLDRARDQAGRRTVLDRAVRLHRQDLQGLAGVTGLGGTGVQLETLRSLATLQTMRERHHSALAAAQLVAAMGAGTKEGARAASRPGRSLAGLRRPEVDDRVFSSEALPPGIRQLLRQLGPLLRPSGHELAQRLASQGITKADRRTRGTPPRPLFDAVAAELGAGDFDLYVTSASASQGPIPLRAEPGSPPAIIIGAQIEELGPGALRFAAARALRLAATNLDAILAGSPEEAGALLVGIIRQFVPDYEHKEVRESLIDLEMAHAERAIPRKLKPQVMPFAVESAGAFDLAALYEATRDAANAVGLLAAGDLPAALSVILSISGTGLAARGRAAGRSGLTLEALGANPEAMALLQFAVSDEFDELARELES